MGFRTIQLNALLSATTGAVAGLLYTVFASSALAQPASLQGTWIGSGRVVLPSGDVERARCRATFRQETTRTFGMSAICATTSTRITQVARVQRVSTNTFVGQFANREYEISGSIRITLRGDRLSASLSGGGGRGTFNLSR